MSRQQLARDMNEFIDHERLCNEPRHADPLSLAAHGRAALLDSGDGRVRFTLGLDDTTSFDFGKVPRQGPGSGKEPG